MKTEHVALVVGALVLGIVGFYAVTHLAAAVKPAPDIDDQMRRLSAGVLGGKY